MSLISIVIPTHNRERRLKENLLAFAKQTANPDSYEIVIVADGCQDDTSRMVAEIRSQLPCRIQFAEQVSSGAAQARNRGASLAASPLLLFLDDDMEPLPDLVAAHLAAHEKNARAAILGRFWTPVGKKENLFSRESRRWWESKFADRNHPGYRFTFLDVFTGNLSLRKEDFEQIGGFDSRMRGDSAGEDYDIGLRLIQSGVSIVYAPNAASIHHDLPTLDRTLNRAQQEGRGQAHLSQKYPELFWYFQISRMSRLSEIPSLRWLWKLLWKNPSIVAPFVSTLRRVVAMAENRGRSDLAWRFYRPLHGYRYFSGVQSVLGSLSEWERLYQDAPPEPPGIREIEIDLARDFDHIDNILEESRPDAVCISHNGTPVIRMKPVAGAEPVRGAHLRLELLSRAQGILLAILAGNKNDQPVHSIPTPSDITPTAVLMAAD